MERSVVVLFTIIIILFITTLAVLYFNTCSKDDADDAETEYLFSLNSEQKTPVTVTNQGTAGGFKVSVKSSSTVRAFTNIPLHKSFHLGDLNVMNILFHVSKDNKLDTTGLDENIQTVINETMNQEELAFIEREPNCTLSFTLYSEADGISHFETIAKMTEITSAGDYTEIEFELLEGETGIPDGVYEYLHCTIDDFWDWLGVGASAVGTALCWGTVNLATAGLATGACVVATIGTIASVASAVKSDRVMFERNKKLLH